MNITDALAVWRLAYMLVNEDGPGRSIVRLRARLGVEQDEDGNTVGWSDWTPLHCVWCTSVWVALGWTLLPRRVRAWAGKVLALSAAVCIVEKQHGKG